MGIFIFSFALNIYGASHFPAGTFYLPFTRFWELIAGSVVAWLHLYKPLMVKKLSQGEINTVVLFGAILLFLGFLFVTKEAKFPGWWGLLPVLGAAALLFAGKRKNFGHLFLASPVMVWLGLISFPLYLWHWPLLSFVRLIYGAEPKPEVIVGVLLLTLFLAWATYWYIERPIRKHPTKKQVAILVFLMVGIGLAGLTYKIGKKAVIQEQASLLLPPPIRNMDTSIPRVMLLGDSHAGHLTSGLQKIFGNQIFSAAEGGCLPFYGVDRYDSRFIPGTCLKLVEKALKTFEADPNMKTIILASMGPVYLSGEAFKNQVPARVNGLGVILSSDPEIHDRWRVYEIGLRATIERLLSLNKEIIFAFDVPELEFDPIACLSSRPLGLWGSDFTVRPRRQYPCAVSRLEYETRNQKYKKLVQSILKDYPQVIVFDPTRYFCDDSWCYAQYKNQFLYSDPDHLSLLGSDFIAQYLSPLVLKSIQKMN